MGQGRVLRVVRSPMSPPYRRALVGKAIVQMLASVITGAQPPEMSNNDSALTPQSLAKEKLTLTAVDFFNLRFAAEKLLEDDAAFPRWNLKTGRLVVFHRTRAGKRSGATSAPTESSATTSSDKLESTGHESKTVEKTWGPDETDPVNEEDAAKMAILLISEAMKSVESIADVKIVRPSKTELEIICERFRPVRSLSKTELEIICEGFRPVRSLSNETLAFMRYYIADYFFSRLEALYMKLTNDDKEDIPPERQGDVLELCTWWQKLMEGTDELILRKPSYKCVEEWAQPGKAQECRQGFTVVTGDVLFPQRKTGSGGRRKWGYLVQENNISKADKCLLRLVLDVNLSDSDVKNIVTSLAACLQNNSESFERPTWRGGEVACREPTHHADSDERSSAMSASSAVSFDGSPSKRMKNATDDKRLNLDHENDRVRLAEWLVARVKKRLVKTLCEKVDDPGSRLDATLDFVEKYISDYFLSGLNQLKDLEPSDREQMMKLFRQCKAFRREAVGLQKPEENERTLLADNSFTFPDCLVEALVYAYLSDLKELRNEGYISGEERKTKIKDSCEGIKRISGLLDGKNSKILIQELSRISKGSPDIEDILSHLTLLQG